MNCSTAFAKPSSSQLAVTASAASCTLDAIAHGKITCAGF
jgi:hypothetical protein